MLAIIGTLLCMVISWVIGLVTGALIDLYEDEDDEDEG